MAEIKKLVEFERYDIVAIPSSEKGMLGIVQEIYDEGVVSYCNKRATVDWYSEDGESVTFNANYFDSLGFVDRPKNNIVDPESAILFLQHDAQRKLVEIPCS